MGTWQWHRIPHVGGAGGVTNTPSGYRHSAGRNTAPSTGAPRLQQSARPPQPAPFASRRERPAKPGSGLPVPSRRMLPAHILCSGRSTETSLRNPCCARFPTPARLARATPPSTRIPETCGLTIHTADRAEHGRPEVRPAAAAEGRSAAKPAGGRDAPPGVEPAAGTLGVPPLCQGCTGQDCRRVIGTPGRQEAGRCRARAPLACPRSAKAARARMAVQPCS